MLLLFDLQEFRRGPGGCGSLSVLALLCCTDEGAPQTLHPVLAVALVGRTRCGVRLLDVPVPQVVCNGDPRVRELELKLRDNTLWHPVHQRAARHHDELEPLEDVWRRQLRPVPGSELLTAALHDHPLDVLVEIRVHCLDHLFVGLHGIHKWGRAVAHRILGRLEEGLQRAVEGVWSACLEHNLLKLIVGWVGSHDL